jgi:hypothetical protein
MFTMSEERNRREGKDQDFLKKKWPLKKLKQMQKQALSLVGKRAKVVLLERDNDCEEIRTLSGEINSVVDFMIFWGTCDKTGTSFYQIERIEGL